jgi:HNH endonuclease
MSKTYIPMALRKLVAERSGYKCEYCLIPESAVLLSHEVDHIFSEKHGGLTQENNLALSCTSCNKFKGSDVASINLVTDEITPLFHPRRHDWLEHFQPQNAEWLPLTPIGAVTVRLLQFNRPDRVEERKLLIEAGLLIVR